MEFYETAVAESPVVRVPVESVGTGVSPRLGGEDLEHVRTLAALDEELPPITVLRSSMEVIDGAHRLMAARLKGDPRIAVRFFDGTAEEAFVLAVRLNITHGLPLSPRDRLIAALRIVASHPDWSDRKVAAASGLSAKTVASLRVRAGTPVDTRVGLDGRLRPTDPARRRERAAELIGERPNASLREIAAEAGIGLGTAKDVRDRLRSGQDVIPPKLRGVREVTPRRSEGRGGAPGPGFPEVFEVLHKDPALRSTEVGRAVLRMLATHRVEPDQLSRLAAGIPVHARAKLVRAARLCAELWTQFGDEVEDRDRRDEAS
ncbi:streptomycin biosynthesis protein [Actinosynnema sp. NPDC020468]|uniref:ParB/RepB/Spo0J family partition protein n=1 Tax=Actinosynnema sp. NPDC020468 TaxID=3154488 RepID=UPI0034001814